jgi:HNH endonuclease
MCPCLADDDGLSLGARRPSGFRISDAAIRCGLTGQSSGSREVRSANGMDGCAGICRDTAHPVDPSRRRPDPLSPSIDHIVAIVAGGAHTRSNVQIAHWLCNQEKNDSKSPLPRYAAALLRRRMFGTPVPARLWQQHQQHQQQSPDLSSRRRLVVLAWVIERSGGVTVERQRLVPRMRVRRARREVRERLRDSTQ